MDVKAHPRRRDIIGLQRKLRSHYNSSIPDSWYDLASDARKAASRLVGENYRSCLSRAYYAAYSKVTFALAAAPGVTFPAGREGPNHPGEMGTGGIRRLIET